jgi:RNA polymerase sigma factor (TIGR02999 family)
MDEVRAMSHGLLQRERHVASLQTTALVLTALRRQRRTDQEWDNVTWQSRQYFFGAVYQAMRRALIDHGRRRATLKRQAELPVEPADLELLDLKRTMEREPAQIVALAEALAWLQQEAPQLAEIVEHRFYGGLTLDETAQMLEVDERTVRRRWQRARLLLYDRILQILNADASTL